MGWQKLVRLRGEDEKDSRDRKTEEKEREEKLPTNTFFNFFLKPLIMVTVHT